MKIFILFLSLFAVAVFVTACTTPTAEETAAEEERLRDAGGAKPVVVPYTNKTIDEVKKDERERITEVRGGTIVRSGEYVPRPDDPLPELVEPDAGYEAGLSEPVDEHAECGDGSGCAEPDELAEPEEECVDDDAADLPSDDEGTPDDEPAGETLTYLGNYQITFYCPCSICCGEWASGYTASGTLATEGRTVAADLPFGTVLEIEGLGRYVVEDRGVYGDAVDVFVSSHDEALALGLQYRDVYLVE